MSKIRKGDDVVVLSGRDKGKRGTVLQIIENNRILVDNVNVIKKHVKPNPNRGETGGIIEKEAPIQISNVALFNPNTNKADRVGYKVLEDGRFGVLRVYLKYHDDKPIIRHHHAPPRKIATVRSLIVWWWPWWLPCRGGWVVVVSSWLSASPDLAAGTR